jgi:hypothetical protein
MRQEADLNVFYPRSGVTTNSAATDVIVARVALIPPLALAVPSSHSAMIFRAYFRPKAGHSSSL